MAERRPFFPERNNIPPERGRIRFGISAQHRGIIATPDRPTTAPTLPRPGQTPPVPEQRPEKPKKHTGRNIALAGTALGVLGVGAYEAYQNIPAIHRMVDSFFLDHLKGSSEASTINSEEIFDNNATEGVVRLNTILYVPEEDFLKTSLADEEGNPIFDFPWDKNHPVDRKYKKELSRSWASWSAKGEVSIDTNAKNEWVESTVLPAGFEFPTIYPGRLFWMGSVYDEEASRKSTSNPYGLAVYKGPITGAKLEFIAQDGTFYFINIGIVDDSGGVEKNLPILPLIDAPLINPENGNGKDWEKGMSIERLQKIFRTTQNGKLRMYINGQKNGSLLGKDFIPGDFKFGTSKDAAGTLKIFVSDSK